MLKSCRPHPPLALVLLLLGGRGTLSPRRSQNAGEPRFQSVPQPGAGRVTSVLGLAHGLPGGATAPPAPESFAATERLPLSVRPLPQHLTGSVIGAPTETSEIGALIRESLKPLTEIARQGIRPRLS